MVLGAFEGVAFIFLSWEILPSHVLVHYPLDFHFQTEWSFEPVYSSLQLYCQCFLFQKKLLFFNLHFPQSSFSSATDFPARLFLMSSKSDGKVSPLEVILSSKFCPVILKINAALVPAILKLVWLEVNTYKMGHSTFWQGFEGHSLVHLFGNGLSAGEYHIFQNGDLFYLFGPSIAWWKLFLPNILSNQMTLKSIKHQKSMTRWVTGVPLH